MTYNQLIERIEGAVVPDLGDVLSGAFELFKKSWLQGFLYVVLSFILVTPAMLLVYTPFLGAAITDAQGVDPFESMGDMAWIPIVPFVFLFLGVIILAQAVIMALQAGLYRSFEVAERGQEVKAGMLFIFLKGKYLWKAFVLSLLSVLIALVATLMCVLPVIYITVPVYFITVIFAFHPDFSAGQIVRVAFKLGNKTWFVSFVLIIISSILAQTIGFLACGVGLLFTSAFIYMPLYLIYKGVAWGQGSGTAGVVPDENK